MIIVLKMSWNNYKCLGLVIDYCLNFRAHTESIGKTVKQKLGTLRRIQNYFTREQMNRLYWGYVIPNILYCSSVWSGRSEVNHDVLNRLHKRAAYMVRN